jgi:hypothetical protein
MTPERRNNRAKEIVVVREQLGKHISSATAVTSRNSRRAAGSGVATRSGVKRTKPLQWDT